jgi:amino acid transporter
MPAWAFAVLMAWLAFIAYLVVVARARWGLLAYLLTLAALLMLRKRRAPPTRVEHSLRRLDDSPRVWAAMGWGTFALGVVMVVLIGGGLAVALSSRDYENLWGKVFGFAISLGVVVAGHWLMRNRRPPFKPPPVG